MTTSDEDRTTQSSDVNREFSGDSANFNHNNDAAAGDVNQRRHTAAGMSFRSTASLTPQQLNRKRENDRRTQRASKERTRNHIEHLERKVMDLKSQQSYQELQRVLRQKESIEAENIEMKERLKSVLRLIQPILGRIDGEDITTAPAQPYIPGSSVFSIKKPSILTSEQPSPGHPGFSWHTNLPPRTSSTHDNRAFTLSQLPHPRGTFQYPDSHLRLKVAIDIRTVFLSPHFFTVR